MILEEDIMEEDENIVVDQYWDYSFIFWKNGVLKFNFYGMFQIFICPFV